MCFVTFWWLLGWLWEVVTFNNLFQTFYMKRSLIPKEVPQSPKVLTRSQNKNALAQRLFDTPGMRGQSQRRPRIFSTDTNQSKLTPAIVKEYQSKKQIPTEQLPPI
jgi:hypothetical protein